MEKTNKVIASTAKLIQDYLKEIDIVIEPKDIKKRDIKKLIIRINKNVEEPRLKGMIHHSLCDIVVIVFLATMCGCEAWTEFEDFGRCHKKWLSRFLELPCGIPSHDTFERVFSMLDPVQLEKATTSFVISFIDRIKKMAEKKQPEDCVVYQQISVDGKEACGSGRNCTSDDDEKIRNLQLLHVYNCSEEWCMFTRAIEEKTNEIPVAQELLSTLNLRHTIVSFDAMNTQKGTVRVIHAQKGDYIGGLKENQPLFYREVRDAFDEETMRKYRKSKKRYVKTVDKAHSCIETREYYMMDDLSWFCDLQKWAGLRSVVLCVSTKERKNGSKTSEYRYYISSLNDINLLSNGIRGHWAIENKLHWELDYSFKEDEQTTMNREALTNLSIIKKMALAIMKLSRPYFGKLLHDNGPISIRRIKRVLSYDTENGLSSMIAFLNMADIEAELQSN